MSSAAVAVIDFCSGDSRSADGSSLSQRIRFACAMTVAM
jgi:hypothetical protein